MECTVSINALAKIALKMKSGFFFFSCCCCCFSASLYLLVILPHTHKMENSSQIGETLKRPGRENNLYPKYENHTICFQDIG